MLCELQIENVAVIEKASVHFRRGLNVLTGETGAGKSILIDSIMAILGSRTSRELVRTGAQKAVIRAIFRELPASAAKQAADAGYGDSDELMLYREISAEGKSVFRINGLPATGTAVRELCSGLIAIHGQNDSHDLVNPARHLALLDLFAENQDLHGEYYRVYRELCGVKKEIDRLNVDEEQKEKRAELLRYQIQEIEDAHLSSGEEETLLERRTRIRHAQSIAQQLGTAYEAMNGGDDAEGAAGLLGAASAALEQIRNLSVEFGALCDRVNELYYTARDAASEIASQMEAGDFDSGELDQIEERLDLLYRLKQKYGEDETEILTYAEQARRELDGIESSEERLEVLYEQQTALYEQARALADRLTQTRLDAFESMNAEVTQALAFLNMPNVRFVLSHKKGPLAGAGQDSVEFLVSANAGEEPRPLGKVASGGELSRIMLALKSAMADKDEIGTVIYDEIDTGVSGLAAARIGEKLHQTSKGRQVICITHTAQIAALADTHLLIEKQVRDGRTFTQITELDNDARASVLAAMISGDKVTELSLANAREMLRAAHA